ncbi:MAG TPA: glycine--tRNA ligase subunit beta [Terriglobales bacterium]|jgi:glycyl-tRNA synthetase beta chain|nr:glycine--tRNA ligase subunit beta [Terriglobales bacterium]
MADFLLEIGCEEIPARMIEAASRELRERLHALLVRERLEPAGVISHLDTPRRLAVLASHIPNSQPDITEQVSGPSVQVAYANGQPTPAAHAFAKKVGVDVGKLERLSTPKGEYLAATITRKGRSAAEILAEALPKEISTLYWPKNMYWRKRGEVFVRPVRWLVAMLDEQVIPVELFGLIAGKISRGHRVIVGDAGGGAVAISRPSGYVEALREAKVLSAPEREHVIRKALDAATRTIPGARWREDTPLVATVVNLTEFPSVILGGFDPEFLDLPEEVLVTVMRDHQKYFAIQDANGKLLPHFLAVLNTAGDSKGLIRHGNERVLRARFNDARFFWQADQKQTLRQRVSLLRNVTFQKDLGSYYDKTLRVQRIASWLAETVKQSGMAIRPGVVHKAALLAKADLTTELVKEFTELQGIVGGLYARVQELDEDMRPDVQLEVSRAIYDHYRPESMEDAAPATIEGAVLSIADKSDSIAGMFALGLIPSGSKDPFALRRQANGIVKTIAEHKLPLRLSRIMADARIRYRGSEAEKKFSNAAYAESVRSFFRERLEFYLKEARGYAYDVVSAVLAVDSDDVVDAIARAAAVSKVRGSADFESISSAFKRMKNILRQAAEKTKVVALRVDPNGLQEESEKELFAQIPQTVAIVGKLSAARDYEGALLEIAKLRPAIDRFFDKVMVMVDDDNLRANRLALLQTVVKEFSTIADFSEIVTEGKETKK